MHEPDGETTALTPEEGWRTVHATMDRAHSSLYLAGTATILLLWGAIVSFGYLSQYAIEVWAADSPWLNAPLWGGLVAAGMLGSAVIGHRAGRANAAGNAARSAGVRVFLFWLAVAVTAFFVPMAAGMGTADDPGVNIPRVTIGIVALGYILFGIMHRPALAAVGVGIAAAFYVPSYIAGDAALVVSSVATLIVVALSAAWIRKSGVL